MWIDLIKKVTVKVFFSVRRDIIDASVESQLAHNKLSATDRH